MKRIATFILLIIYFVTSTGATMHYHYCMGEVAGSSIWKDTEKKCGKCGMEKEESEDNGCCKDERQWIKIENDQKNNKAQPEFSKLEPGEISFVFLISTFFTSQFCLPPGESKARLRSHEIPTYLLNCVFRI